ncbi:MAG: SKP1 21-like [Trebouxia sp. A1-2]|nr:MAG: SKP1 21-like [Trebouxia sp. A1-2]
MPPSQTAQALPQGLSEEALKEALQVQSIWVESQDVQEARCQEIEREVALLSPFIQREVLRCGHGLAQADPVVLPKQVNPDVLSLLLDYCRFHRAPGRSDKERKLFDEKFIRLDTRRLCELTSAADALDMKPLVDLTSRALARMIEGKSAEEIRETFHLPDDLTEEEKLEPVKNATADPRIRLLNRLYAKKRKELAHKKAEEVAAEARARQEAQAPSDDRNLEDLLSFIGTEPPGAKPKGKQKKKRGKKKNSMLNAASLDSEASQLVEARPSCDPLPATVSPTQEPGQSLHQSSISSTPVTAAPMAAGGEGAIKTSSAAPISVLSNTTAADNTLAQPNQQLDSKLEYAQSQQAQPKQIAEPVPLHHQGQHSLEPLQQLEQPPANTVLGTDWGQANGHGAQPSPPAPAQQDGVLDNETSITDEDDAALLADMQGFASALGCDWQVRRPDMVSLGTLPLPGAHITTLTSLANFKPGHADKFKAKQCDSELDASSRSAGGDSQESELDTDDELEAAYEDRQAANMREANFAYDIAMSRVAAEDNKASFRPHWPDDPTHASHASFDDWAANGLHANGTPKALASHGSFSFANGCQETPAYPELQYRQPSAWPDSVPEVSVQESRRGSIDVQAVQHLFQDFLQKAGLDSHLEVRSISVSHFSPSNSVC